jgi:hypothetical protein
MADQAPKPRIAAEDISNKSAGQFQHDFFRPSIPSHAHDLRIQQTHRIKLIHQSTQAALRQGCDSQLAAQFIVNVENLTCDGAIDMCPVQVVNAQDDKFRV